LKYGLSAPLFVGMLIFSSLKLEANTVAESEFSIGSSNALDVGSSNRLIQVKASPTFEEFYRKNPNVKKISWTDKGVIILYKNGKSERFPLETADQKKVVQSKFGPLPSIFPPPKRYPKPILKDPGSITSGPVHKQSQIDVQADFPGGIQKFFDFVGANYKMPKEAIDNNINGRLIISFIINGDGTLMNPKIVRDLGFGTGAEALRVIKLSPKWRPAMKGTGTAKAVASTYTIPIAIGNKADNENKLELKGPDADKAFILLDGKQITLEEFKKLDGNSIESIDVMKDKSKFHQYGAPEESSGVISIKTKK
jgi:hypothetical protein